MKRTLPINQDNLSLINFVFLRNPKQDRMYSGVRMTHFMKLGQ
jgi:hypothetical protein